MKRLGRHFRVIGVAVIFGLGAYVCIHGLLALMRWAFG